MSVKPYSIILNEKEKILRVSAQGVIQREQGHTIVSEALKNAADHSCHILCDVRQAVIKATLADWFYMPRMLSIFKDPKVRLVATALLITPGKQEKDYSFYETVVRNLGMRFKIFTSEKDALAWLDSEQ